MNTLGKQLVMDIWYDQDVEPITDKIGDLIQENFTVVKNISHEFSPHGRTIVFILSESHFAVHTYPEHNYITLDIYICDPEYDLNATLEQILAIQAPVKYHSAIIERGLDE